LWKIFNYYDFFISNFFLAKSFARFASLFPPCFSLGSLRLGATEKLPPVCGWDFQNKNKFLEKFKKNKNQKGV